MTNYEDKIIEKLFKNAIRFLNITVDEILGTNMDDIDSIIKICVLIQTTVELSLKYGVSYNSGNLDIRKIIDKKYKHSPIEVINEEFENNRLKVDSFESLRKYIKANSEFGLSSEETAKMNHFQNIRNKLLHFSYNFSEDEIDDIKNTFLFIILKIIIPLLYEGYSEESINHLSPNEFLKVYIGQDKFNKISVMTEYKNVMQQIIQRMKNNGDIHIGYCIFCKTDSWIIESGKCFICEMSDCDDTLLNCPVCKRRKTVMYESLNMACNNNATFGTCIKCHSKMSVIKCKKCGRYNVYEGPEAFYEAIENIYESICDNDCSNIPSKEKLPTQYAYAIPALILSECINNNEVIIINNYKNPIRILGNKCEDAYIDSNNLQYSIEKSLDYLESKNYIQILLSKNEFIKRVYDYIDEKYRFGSSDELSIIYSELQNSIHGKDVMDEFHKLFHNLPYRLKKRQLLVLTEREREILYKCRDYLHIDDKIMFGIYDFKNPNVKPNKII